MTTLYKCVDGINVPLTQPEVTEYLAMQADFESSATTRLTQQCTEALAIAIDQCAQQKQYKDAVSCASYAQSTNAQWAAQATTFIQWRDTTFIYAYDYLAKAQSGEISNPSLEVFMSGIVPIVWPN